MFTQLLGIIIYSVSCDSLLISNITIFLMITKILKFGFPRVYIIYYILSFSMLRLKKTKYLFSKRSKIRRTLGMLFE